jgi:putative peptide maturation dehydrogenase
MRIRRCSALTIEPRERLELNLSLLSKGGNGLHSIVEQMAIAPHLESEVLLTPDEVATLCSLSPSRWAPWVDLAHTRSASVLEALLEKGLVIAEGSAQCERDQRLRDTHWRTASVTMHFASRWTGVDTEAAEREFLEVTEGTLLDRLGVAPPAVRERVPREQRQALPSIEPTPLDRLLGARVTCRNFDRSRSLSMPQFSATLHRTFGARTTNDYAPGVELLKKGVPSAGGLHPTEAYLLVQRVDGVIPGLYHYHPVDHALEPIRTMTLEETNALARTFVASQAYFVDAHVMVMPTSRFIRNFWKYRNHAKAYRALILDVGHLSQTLYLAATELGLAAFITAAVNEIDIENAFGLDPLEEGPLAVCGFGLRGPERNEVEFDPLNAVWPG